MFESNWLYIEWAEGSQKELKHQSRVFSGKKPVWNASVSAYYCWNVFWSVSKWFSFENRYEFNFYPFMRSLKLFPSERLFSSIRSIFRLKFCITKNYIFKHNLIVLFIFFISINIFEQFLFKLVVLGRLFILISNLLLSRLFPDACCIGGIDPSVLVNY